MGAHEARLGLRQEAVVCVTIVIMRFRSHVVIRIDKLSRKTLERIAKMEDDSVARVIRRAISEYLHRYERKHKKRELKP